MGHFLVLIFCGKICLCAIQITFCNSDWLVERGREEEARKSLRILRGADYNLDEELAEIVAKKRAKELTGKSVGSTLVSGTFWRPFLRCIA